ncbi:hypothetical protein BH688_04855 [Kushneria phosphatilytica]|nr:hypothetical protein BH688_04855 [Kushneria phosphatilytica]
MLPPHEQKKLLGIYESRNFSAAERYAETLTQRYPHDAFGWKVLGSCLHKNGHIKKAQETLQRSLDIKANDAQTQHLMARAWYDLGEPQKALGYAREAIALEPGFAQGHFTVAEILTESDLDKEALEHALKAEELGYEKTACLFIRGHIQTKRRHYQEALNIVQELVRVDPDNPFVQNEIANLYKDLGQFDQAEAAYRKAMALDADFDVAFSNLLVCMHYNPDVSSENILDTIKQWENQFPSQPDQYQHASSSAVANKVIRLGMVSSGFRMHPVGQMILTGLERLNPGFELHFYSTNNADDDLTQRLKKVATSWNLVRHLEQDELADRIHQDGIDILLDLSGYGEGSRLRTMSYKPAPLIIKWVGGLINTMGLSSFDYLISDNIETPEGVDDWYTEKLIRMPNDYICYLPAPDAPPITALPAMSNGYITLGCFNNPAKINPELLGEWAKLMHELPNSRLFLKSGQYDSQDYCDRIRTIMHEHGISAERLLLEGPSNHRQLLEAYNKVDIALDTWPYSGGLTTCEAFMMGVPVVTYPGPTFAGRHSATHLINAGMSELVTGSWDEYRQRVIELASDIPNLSVIRACLRQFLMQSPVCDAEKFGKHFSTAMRAVWQRHCESKKPAALSLNSEGSAYFDNEKTAVSIQKPSTEGITAIDAHITQSLQSQWAQVSFNILLSNNPANKKSHDLPAPLIVSLTSYPKRFSTLPFTLQALLSQTIKADHIVLWIAHEDRECLDGNIRSFENRGIEIRFCEDLRSYKKIIPALEYYKDCFIVTADDDLYYKPTWLEELTGSYRHEKEVVAHRAHKIVLDKNGSPAPYKMWEWEYSNSQTASELIFPTTGYGTLFPPNIFHPDVRKREIFEKLSPDADDVWLYWMCRLNNATFRVTGGQPPFTTWPESQLETLWHHNVLDAGNDEKLSSLIGHYGSIFDKKNKSGQRQHPLTNYKDENFLFIIGCGRSGNTLMRKLLMEHLDVFIPPENYVLGTQIHHFLRMSNTEWPHIVQDFLNTFKSQKDFEAFGVNDISSFKKKAITWPESERNFSRLVIRLYNWLAAQQGISPKWLGDKTPLNTLNLEYILNAFPNAKFIFMERDPFDVVSSYMEAGIYTDATEAARRWKNSYLSWKKQLSHKGKNQQVLIKYEDFVTKPEETVKNIGKTFGVPKRSNNKDRKIALGDVDLLAHHGNVKKTTFTSSIGKGRKKLKSDDIFAIEKELGDLITQRSYSL